MRADALRTSTRKLGVDLPFRREAHRFEAHGKTSEALQGGDDFFETSATRGGRVTRSVKTATSSS